jgi:NAD(P)-dependent dehydrogenase (short-subunit alcohol dehydrogenase family)
MNTLERFLVKEKVCIITGAGGLLGEKHAEAILEGGGIPVLLDLSMERLQLKTGNLKRKYGTNADCYECDITNENEILRIKDSILKKHGRIDVLINNAANNPKVEDGLNCYNRFELFDEKFWDADMSVGLKGAFFCTKVFGSEMARQKNGVILNISSDLGLIAPDQRIYRKEGLEEEQPTKPVTYSVVKHGLIGLTKYTATYWANKGVRANAICPGGIYAQQDEVFLTKLCNLIPMGRMADADEYKAAVLFLISEASSYMTGAVIAMDGGRSCW